MERIVQVQACAIREFEKSKLLDKRHKDQAVTYTMQMLMNGTASIPEQSGTRTSMKRSYRLLANLNVTHARLLSGHVTLTVEECLRHGTIWVVQDTTTASFGGKRAKAGLGPVNSNPKAKGMHIHTSLALSDSGDILGVLDQETWVRSDEKKDRFEAPHQRKKRDRESQRWLKAQERIEDLFAPYHGLAPKLVLVADREADIFELFEELDELQHSFVIRASHNRLLEEGTDQERLYLLTQVQQAPVLATECIDVPASQTRKARQATLQMRALQVSVMPPKNRDRKGLPIRMNIVLAEEINPPSLKDCLRWFLLTREPIASSQDVLRVMRIYRKRWVAEEFHKGLKSGCALEQRQLATRHSLENFLAIATITAVLALDLRDQHRREPHRPAHEVLDPTYLRVLVLSTKGLPLDCNLDQAYRSIARLGGYAHSANSKQLPGWMTLIKGLSALAAKVEGFLLGQKSVFGQLVPKDLSSTLKACLTPLASKALLDRKPAKRPQFA